MYSVDVDYDRKIIQVTVSGCLKKEELQELNERLSEYFNQLQKREVLLLVFAEKLDTIPQECIQEFFITTELCLKQAKKIAEVHARTVTRMQSGRVEQIVKQKIKQKQIEKENQEKSHSENPIENQKDTNHDEAEIEILRFRTRSEAMAYLLDK